MSGLPVLPAHEPVMVGNAENWVGAEHVPGRCSLLLMRASPSPPPPLPSLPSLQGWRSFLCWEVGEATVPLPSHSAILRNQ